MLTACSFSEGTARLFMGKVPSCAKAADCARGRRGGAAGPSLQSMPMNDFDVQVQGAGIVGRSLALALARAGLRVALRADATRPADADDVRAYALNAASVELLRGLKVWDALPAHAATAVLDIH